jgi:NodT family efflux transporter outer membrane factor (OMF) lipoprotein
MAFVRSSITGIAAALIVTGCTVGPDYRAPALDLPRSWAGTGSAEASPEHLALWWHALEDPDLDRLVDQALAAAPDLDLARARLRQARASRAQAAGAYYPSLTASAGASRSGGTTATGTSGTGSIGGTGSFGQLEQSGTLYQAGFDASWEIDLFGGTRRSVEAAEADLGSREADLNNARVTLIAETAENYVAVRSDQQRLVIARSNLASQSETLQITEWRYQAGLASSSDVEQARTNRAQTRARLPDLESDLASAYDRIATLLGRNPGEIRAELVEARTLPEVPASMASGIPTDLLRQRPDVAAAERTLAAETARVGQKEAQRYPSLTLDGSLAWEAFGTGSLSRSISASLSETLFDGGRLKAQVDAQDAVREQAYFTYVKTVRGALEEVENALAAYAASRDRIDARRTAAASARSAAELIRRTYQTGLADFQKVLDAERTQLSAEDDLASAEATQVTALVKLYKALGGGWDAPAIVAEN